MIRWTVFVSCSFHALVLAAAPMLILDGPEVLKLDWGVRALTHADVDQDGREDLAVINNDRARIEILYQVEPGAVGPSERSLRPGRWEPVLEDARFERSSAVSGIAMYDLKLGDVTGDGRPDVIFTSKDEPLVVARQLEDGSWGEKRTFDGLLPLPWSSTLQLVELSEESAGLEIVVLSKNKLLIFEVDDLGVLSRLQESHRPEAGGANLTVFPASEERPMRFAFRVPGSSRALRIVDWNDESGLGPEKAFAMDSAARGMAWLDYRNDPSLVFIEHRTNRLRIDKLEPVDVQTAITWAMEFYATGATAADATAYCRGDFDEDGFDDVIVADSTNAQVWRMAGTAGGGWQAGRSYPSYQGVKGTLAADVDSDGSMELLVLSAGEKAIGVSDWNGERFSFPDSIQIESEPKQFLWLAEAKQLVILANREGRYEVQILSHGTDSWARDILIPLPDVRREPTGMMATDLDQNGSTDLLLTIPRDAARYIDLGRLSTLDANEAETAVSKVDGLRDLDLTQTGLGDINGDGIPELLVASQGFVRAIRLNEKMQRVVLDQFNSRSGNDRLAIPHLRDVNRDGEPELLLYDEKAKGFQVLERDEAGIFRYARSIDFGEFNPLGLLDPLTGSEETIVTLGNNVLVRSAYADPWEELEMMSSYESDLANVVYNDVAVADFNRDGDPEIVLIDGQNNVLEILAWSAPDDWQSLLHFNVFEEDLHYGGRTGAPLEPREILLGDFSSDGREDIVLLVHDRLLFYPQAGSSTVAGTLSAAGLPRTKQRERAAEKGSAQTRERPGQLPPSTEQRLER